MGSEMVYSLVKCYNRALVAFSGPGCAVQLPGSGHKLLLRTSPVFIFTKMPIITATSSTQPLAREDILTQSLMFTEDMTVVCLTQIGPDLCSMLIPPIPLWMLM